MKLEAFEEAAEAQDEHREAMERCAAAQTVEDVRLAVAAEHAAYLRETRAAERLRYLSALAALGLLGCAEATIDTDSSPVASTSADLGAALTTPMCDPRSGAPIAVLARLVPTTHEDVPPDLNADGAPDNAAGNAVTLLEGERVPMDVQLSAECPAVRIDGVIFQVPVGDWLRAERFPVSVRYGRWSGEVELRPALVRLAAKEAAPKVATLAGAVPAWSLDSCIPPQPSGQDHSLLDLALGRLEIARLLKLPVSGSMRGLDIKAGEVRTVFWADPQTMEIVRCEGSEVVTGHRCASVSPKGAPLFCDGLSAMLSLERK